MNAAPQAADGMHNTNMSASFSNRLDTAPRSNLTNMQRQEVLRRLQDDEEDEDEGHVAHRRWFLVRLCMMGVCVHASCMSISDLTMLPGKDSKFTSSAWHVKVLYPATSFDHHSLPCFVARTTRAHACAPHTDMYHVSCITFACVGITHGATPSF